MSATPWRPIEEAPKDGREVILGRVKRGKLEWWDMGYYSEILKQWCDINGYLYKPSQNPTHYFIPGPPDAENA
jgi:hypothetical protein